MVQRAALRIDGYDVGERTADVDADVPAGAHVDGLVPGLAYTVLAASGDTFPVSTS